MRKNARRAAVTFRSCSPVYCWITFRSGKSLRSGYGSLSESANVFCEKGLLALIPRIWTFSSWNVL
jgi:hypothetical protein